MRSLFTALRRLAALERNAEALPGLLQGLNALEKNAEALPELVRRMDALASELGAISTRIGGLEPAVDEHRRELQVRTVMDWVADATVHTAPLVSVVLPTRDRCALLRRAIASVLAQTYPHWELLIVDDGSVDDTPALLAGIGSERVRAFRGHGAGPCATRNIALAHARGEIIAYVDDDNTMHPGWLKAVVWGFEQRPETEVLYGAFVVDDTARLLKVDRGDLPRLYFHRYDHRAVAQDNIADMGCIAHRAGLAEAHFDESLREMGDWDLFLRLTRERPPLALPAIACFYTTDAPNRLTNGPTHTVDAATVRAKNRR
jgi:hypothetical protein